MKITNKTNLPQAFVDFARSDKYSKGQSDISVTSLIDSPKVRIMKEHFHDDMEVDAVDMMASNDQTVVFGDQGNNLMAQVETFRMVQQR